MHVTSSKQVREVTSNFLTKTTEKICKSKHSFQICRILKILKLSKIAPLWCEVASCIYTFKKKMHTNLDNGEK